MMIETNRLTIRSFLESDIPEYAAIVADPEVTKHVGDGSPHSYEEAAAYVVDCVRSETQEGIARYAVILRETGELIGFCGFNTIHDYIDFGWRYARRAWGNGYATEAAAAVLEYGMNTLKLCGIAVESAVENVGSVRVIEKIGMQFEAFGEVRGRKTVRYRQPSGYDRIGPAYRATVHKDRSMDDKIVSRPHLHVIWDSDGSLDGVIGLLYFLQHPDISVEALTVSCGEAYPDIYTANLPRMLARIGRRMIPIAAGRATPLAGNNAFPQPWRAAINAFLGIDLPEVDDSIHPLPAAELIVKVLNESPRPVTLFVCGTHTNLAEALRLDPSIKNKIASVQVMGGALYVPGNIESEWPEIRNRVAEWNIWVDPLAASEVFNAGLSLYITPLDATNQMVWTSDDADTWEAVGTPEGRLAAEILRRYLDFLHDYFPEGMYMWDLVTAVNVTNPDLCHGEQVHIQVVTEPGEEEGRTVVVRDQPPNATAYLTPKADEIKQLVARTLGLPRDDRLVS